MLVVRAKSAGFCMGVGLALRQLNAAIHEELTPLATLGPIIHNPQVIEHYESKGVRCTESSADLEYGEHVLIRAHGVTLEEQEQLLLIASSIIDATCPRVKEAQLLIQAQQEKCKGILLLFGEQEHPEVRGLVSYAKHQALVFDSLEKLKSLPLDSAGPYYLAAQTTQDQEAFVEIANWLKERYPAIVILDTICSATRRRQTEAIEIAQSVDIMVVVGGHNSGNTRRLAEIVKAQGIPVLHVETLAALQRHTAKTALHEAQRVGLTAGASTPAAHIDAIEEWLKTGLDNA